MVCCQKKRQSDTFCSVRCRTAKNTEGGGGRLNTNQNVYFFSLTQGCDVSSRRDGASLCGGGDKIGGAGGQLHSDRGEPGSWEFPALRCNLHVILPLSEPRLEKKTKKDDLRMMLRGRSGLVLMQSCK